MLLLFYSLHMVIVNIPVPISPKYSSAVIKHTIATSLVSIEHLPVGLLAYIYVHIIITASFLLYTQMAVANFCIVLLCIIYYIKVMVDQLRDKKNYKLYTTNILVISDK